MSITNYKTKIDSFIGGWIIEPKICDDLIKFFETKKVRQEEGMVANVKGPRVDHKVKKSTEISMYSGDSAFDDYNKALQKCLEKYMERYPEVNKQYDRFDTM